MDRNLLGSGETYAIPWIAAAVIGGTLLTGGVGTVVGSLFGSLIKGIIETIITFQGTLSSWWTRIVTASQKVYQLQEEKH